MDLDSKETGSSHNAQRSESSVYSGLAEINRELQSLGSDHAANIQRLTVLCGELLNATCAFYNRLEDGLLTSPRLLECARGL